MNALARNVVRLGSAAAMVVAPIAMTAPPAHAGTAVCVIGAINTPPAGTVNCQLDTIGGCTYFYDPLLAFPTQVAGETTQYAICLVL